MDVGEPSYTGEIHGGELYVYGLGFFFGFFFLIIVFYISYICKRYMCSQRPPPPPPPISSTTTTIDAAVIRFSGGLDDDVLVTFPTFVYSEFSMPRKGDGCYICLAEYKPVDTVRLLPECGHLFHVRCIDTWLKAHPTCPVCRKSLVVA
ncbi:putative transcription factor C2H2 family [Helianthus anomalus]